MADVYGSQHAIGGKLNRVKVRVIAGLLTGVMLSVPTAASATGDSAASAEDVVRVVSLVEPVAAPIAEVVRVEDGDLIAEASSTDVVVTVPHSSDELIVVGETGSSSRPSKLIAISLPEEANVGDGELTDSGVMVYQGQAVDVAVQPIEDGSVRINTVINSASSPHTFTYALDVPSSAVLELQDDGSVQIRDGENWLGGVAPPWATDAAGVVLDTHYEVDGHQLIQEVEPTLDAAYPIVADPWLGKALVSKTVWQWQPAYKGYTLKVYPTVWGRAGAFVTVGGATYFWLRSSFWNEVKSKTAGTREETNSMRDQFYCHVDFVRIYDPKKASWNIDTWRPNVSYKEMIRSDCNPK